MGELLKSLTDANFLELALRFLFNLFVAFVIIRWIYTRYTRDSGYVFTFFMFSTIIFFVCYLLSNVQLSIGFAFGLFAVFSILRYRTDTIPIKEMTYMFLLITISVINALTSTIISYPGLIFSNLAIIAVTYVLEYTLHNNQLREQVVHYEKIENIKPENSEALLNDLRDRTGLDIRRTEIERIDFLRDTALIKVYYRR